jgi:hypothetical protein
MLSSKLLLSLSATLVGKKCDWEQFIAKNDPSEKSEDGTVADLMTNITHELVSGYLRLNKWYFLSDVPLHEATPDVIFSNVVDGGKTSVFGYEIDDYFEE